jgi:hypothetical protein
MIPGHHVASAAPEIAPDIVPPWLCRAAFASASLELCTEADFVLAETHFSLQVSCDHTSYGKSLCGVQLGNR